MRSCEAEDQMKIRVTELLTYTGAPKFQIYIFWNVLELFLIQIFSKHLDGSLSLPPSRLPFVIFDLIQ